MMSVLLVIFYYIPGPSYGGKLENSLDAFEQIKNSAELVGAFVGSIFSIAFFNYFGVSVTKVSFNEIE